MVLQNLLNYVNEYRESLQEIKDENIELEIKILLDPRIKTPTFANKSPDLNSAIATIKSVVGNVKSYGNPSISQTINFIHTESTHMFIKQLFFNNGVQDKEKKRYYIKKSLIQPIYLISNEINQPSYKLSVNSEIEQKNDINQFDIVRFRLRYSIDFNIEELKDWKLELTLIKETNDSSLSQLKKFRDELFATNINCDNFLENVNWLNVDRLELELEYKGSREININHIVQLDKLWQILQTKQRLYSDCVYQIAQIIKPDNLDKFKSGHFGLKQLGTNPIELTKKSYNKDILSNIENFVLTEKIDGIRSMLIIYPKKGECHIINKQYRYLDIPTNCDDDLIILDAEEYIDENNNKLYYVFDCIWYNKNISDLVFCGVDCRLLYVERCVAQYDFLKSKHFIYLSQLNYADQIHQFNDLLKTLPYENDGFIFISKNANYNNTLNYKWKPLEKMTIDFVARKCPAILLGINPYTQKENQTLYLLFAGIRDSDYKKLGINKIQNYETIFKKVQYKDQYFPIQFSPSSDPYAYLFWSDNHHLDGNIVELTRTISLDSQDNSWQLVKIRDDRNIDMMRKTYYGNYFKFAEYIWMNYSNPLTLANLCEPINQGYFQQDDNSQYTYIRKFNNFVKSQLTQMYAKKKTKADSIDWVIDLASGKGQDLSKYIECNIKNILMIDIDDMGLMEIINRKHNYINDKTIKHVSKIYIKKLDLADSYKNNLLKIQDSRFGIPSDGAQLVVCNLALHYLVQNKRKIQNFCGLLHKLMNYGSIFIFTAFNGRKVFNKLKNSDEPYERRVDNKLIYSIKKKYTETEFTGINQKIDVLLPFSDGNYYTEYLINDDLLSEELAKKKIILINEDSFDIYLDKFKENKPHFHKSLTEIDREFISLYSFYIFHKPNKSRR